MLVYLLQITLNLTFTYVIYRWVLENLKTHRFNRFFLLFSVAASLALPLFSISFNNSLPTYQTRISEISAVFINLEKENSTNTTSTFNWYTLLFFVYLIGVGIALFKFNRNIYKLISLRKQGRLLNQNRQNFVFLTNIQHPFTFGNTIYLPENTSIEKPNEIILHELVHVRQKHSLDILFIELLHCFFWFHPLFYFFKIAIALNHEFLADYEVTNQRKNTDEYLKLLLTQTYENNEIPLSSSFNFNLTKKRFIMITKKNNPFKNALSIALACATLTLTGVLSTQAQEKDTQIEAAIQVDEKAEPIGGMLKFQQYVISKVNTEHIKVEENQEKTMVILQFNVDTDGSITDAKIFRSNVDEESNKMMLEALKNSGKWKPAKIDGKAVKSQFTLPITIEIPNIKVTSK